MEVWIQEVYNGERELDLNWRWGVRGVQGDELVIPSACGLDNLVESITNN